ncbi:MAG: hypothetical protein LBQ63_05050 [Deltaproteobacteria bacterium]|jgi:hypothetical protein|nr:hypothetical protein [Deltaproteobacteria bacterium]
MNDALLDLAEKSAESDLAFLIKAKEEVKKRMKDNPSPEVINAFNKAKDAVEAETARLSASPPARVYKTQLDAVAYLRDAGFKISKSQFNRDVKARRMPTNADGHFEEPALLGYAAVCLAPAAQLENRAMAEATAGRLSADAELKTYQAARHKLKLEKEQGLLMPRADHERDLAARALFFKKEVENFIHLHGPGIIHLVGGEENRLPELVAHWEKVTADWMNAWAGEREFVVWEEEMGEATAAEEAEEA